MEMEFNQTVISTGNLMSTLTLLFPKMAPCPILSAVKNQDLRTEKCETKKIEETRDIPKKIIHYLCDEKYPHFG
jgi:hypothetical protein